MAGGHLVIDTRPSPRFGAGHLPGAINVHLSSPEFEQRVGWVAPAEVPLVLVLDQDGEAPRAMRALAFVGLDARVSGFLPGGSEAWVDSARALETLGRQLMVEPIAFELLPRKFTLRQLQVLYEAILGIEIDNRNFRKKVLSSGYLRETGKREKHVAHKPAMFYSFDKGRFQKDVRQKFRLNFINWQL